MKKMKMVTTVLCMTVMMFGAVPSASAGPITWADPIVVSPASVNSSDESYMDVADIQWSGFASDEYKLPNKLGWDANYPNNPNDAAAISYVTGTTFTGSEFYYHDAEASPNFLITDNFAVSGPIYMVVKDGNADPMWYIFNLTGWNGVTDIQLNNFWPGNGSISHIGIFGNGTSVPEPTTLLLLGLGLVGLAGFRRGLKK